MFVFVGTLAGPDGPWFGMLRPADTRKNASVYTGWAKKLFPGLIAAYQRKIPLYSKDTQTGHLSSGARRESKSSISVRVVYTGWPKKLSPGYQPKNQLYTLLLNLDGQLLLRTRSRRCDCAAGSPPPPIVWSNYSSLHCSKRWLSAQRSNCFIIRLGSHE